MKRTLILIAACLTVMLFSGDISQAGGLICCNDGYESISVYQWKNGACLKNSTTHSCARVNECTPQCNQGDNVACILAGHIWKGSPYCQCYTGCGSSIVQNCLSQGRDTDPDTCQCTGTCSMSFVSACMNSGGWIDNETCKCHHSDPCEYPVAHIIYGIYGYNCVDCGIACGTSTGGLTVISYYSADGYTYCGASCMYDLEPEVEVCFETSICYQLCGLGCY